MEEIQENWQIVNSLQRYLFGPDSNGTLWQPVVGSQPGASNAYLHFFRTALFNRWQRMQARFLYKTCGFAISAVDNLSTLVLGQGFLYRAESDAAQKRLDSFMKTTKWHYRRCESFRRVLVDGECFERIYDDQLRFVDPDSVFDDTSNMGVITAPNDYEEITEYVIHNRDSVEHVPADQIQHRKIAGFDELRGTSILFAIASHLVEAENLIRNLTRSADQLTRITMIREHQANQNAVTQFRSDIRSQPQNQPHVPYVDGNQSQSRETHENYPAGSILDLPTSVKAVFPGQTINAEGFIAVLRAELRLIAARVGLPENVLSQDQDSMAAYAASLVADSHCVKAMEHWQQMLTDWDVELLERMGFDNIHVVCPEVAIHDKQDLVRTGEFMLANRLASKKTVAKAFELDYEAEVEQMVLEEPEDVEAEVSAVPDILPDVSESLKEDFASGATTVKEHLNAVFAKGLKADNLSPEIRQEYAANLQAVFKRMTPAARERVANNLHSARFYESVQHLGNGLAEKSPAVAEKIAKGGTVGGSFRTFKNKDTGELHLDGLFQGKTIKQTGKEVYAHELSHAIDGPKHEISNSPEWQDAYAKEIQGGQIGKYAATSSSEGFAEFGRLVHADDADHDFIKANMPLSHAVWESHNILPDAGTGTMTQPQEVFSESTDDAGIHADHLANSEPTDLDKGDDENQ